MRILVKTDKGLRNLGEGRIYSKSQLRLQELDANLGVRNDIQAAQNAARRIINSNPAVTSASSDAGKIDGQNDSNSGEGVSLQLPLNANGQQLAQAQKMTKDQNANDVQITFVKPQTGKTDVNSMSESRLAEMRENSVPFTKAELDSFLRSL